MEELQWVANENWYNPTRPHSLARAFADLTYKVGM